MCLFFILHDWILVGQTLYISDFIYGKDNLLINTVFPRRDNGGAKVLSPPRVAAAGRHQRQFEWQYLFKLPEHSAFPLL